MLRDDGFWILPTYKRPASCQEALDAIDLCSVETRGVVLVDGDADPAYRDLQLPVGWDIEFHADNLDLGGRLNGFYDAHPNLSWYGIIGDDHRVRTQEWDKMMLDRTTPFAVSYCEDGWRTPKHLAGAQIFDGGLLRAWGFWAPRGLRHCYIDNFWNDMIRAGMGVTFCGNVLVEELHDGNGKAPTDETYLHGRASVTADQRVYDAFKEGGGIAAAASAMKTARSTARGPRT